MKKEDVVQILSDSYFNAVNAKTKEVAVTLHIFGIKYAEEIKEYGSLANLVKNSGVPLSYVVEINKGMNISKFVSLKNNAYRLLKNQA